MWNWSVAFAVAFGFCSSSGCRGPDPGEVPRQVATPDEPTWRSSLETFQYHLGRVETGWTVEQLLEHAGRPDEQGDGCSYYWVEDPHYGGYYCHFTFKTVGGVVTEIFTSAGHETRSPRPGMFQAVASWLERRDLGRR